MTCILDETIRKLAEATHENPHLARANFLTARDAACRTWDKIYADYRAYAGSDAEVLAIRASQTCKF